MSRFDGFRRSMRDFDLERAVKSDLQKGETLLWSGRPRPWSMMVQSLPIVLFSPFSGLLGARLGRKRVISFGILFFAALLAYSFTLSTVTMTKIVLPLCGVAWSLILVNSLPMVLDMAPRGHLGIYTGLYYLASQLSAIMGPLLAGFIIQSFANDYAVAFLYGAVTLLIAWACMRPVTRGEAVAGS